MIQWTKKTVLKISGYKSPIKDLYTDIKETADTQKSRPLDLSSIDTAKVTRNLKITCYVLLAVIIYNIYKAIGAQTWMDLTFATLVMILATVFYARYAYSIWIIETDSKASMKDWIALSKSNLRLLLPF